VPATDKHTVKKKKSIHQFTQQPRFVHVHTPWLGTKEPGTTPSSAPAIQSQSIKAIDLSIDRTSHQTQDRFQSGHSSTGGARFRCGVRALRCASQPPSICTPFRSQCAPRIWASTKNGLPSLVFTTSALYASQFLALNSRELEEWFKPDKWPPTCTASRPKWRGRLARSCHPRISHTARNSYAPKA
jgi:hypothetical protein